MMIDNRYYDSLGDDWWDPKGPAGLLLRMNRFRLQYFRGVLGNPKGLKILDVGCGGGFLAEAFAADGADVCGLDLSRRSVQTARDHATQRNLCLRVVTGRAETLPFAAGVFDAVLLADVLEHLDEYKTAIAESSRVLKTGGLLLYETVNRTWLSRLGAIWVMEYLLRRIPLRSHDWKMFIRPTELVEVLETCGLRNQELHGLPFKGGLPGMLIRLATGQDPWVFACGKDTRISYLGHAIKSDSDN
jgi:2-polyprenyl-6-hydroxyphenyl methylase/3-demethylubiquinone-9 3-methyltransferase